MNTQRIIGIVLIVFGVLALAFQGISYKKREKVLDIGPIEATTEKTETIPIYPVVGCLFLAGGVLLLIFSNTKQSV
jgi:drug/metabolite transporter (DMT)-like permease